ncbi:MAG TPA: helix-turn-helix domain-containing protein [Nitrospira sp.]|nr:helix-turn-helix domain-containing protein [Nitrospira sp.]
MTPEAAHTHSVPEIMTLAEAAAYLRLSKSTLYQRKDIPRHRIPGSREVRFLRDELLDWLKSGDVVAASRGPEVLTFPLDRNAGTVYHRNPRYR